MICFTAEGNKADYVYKNCDSLNYYLPKLFEIECQDLNDTYVIRDSNILKDLYLLQKAC